MGRPMKRKQGLRSQPSDPIGERDQWTRRHCGEPSCMGDNFPRQSRNPNHGFPKGLHVSIKRIAG
jgi:hypothetical protein